MGSDKGLFHLRFRSISGSIDACDLLSLLLKRRKARLKMLNQKLIFFSALGLTCSRWSTA